MKKRFLVMSLLLVVFLSHMAAGETDPSLEGINASREGRYMEAFRFFNEAAALYSARNDEVGRGKALLEMGKIHTIFSRFDEADRINRESLQCLKSSREALSEALFYAGINDSLKGDEKGALRCFEDCLKIRQGPERAPVLLQIGDLYFVRKEFNKAFRWYDGARMCLAREDASFTKSMALDSTGEAYRTLNDPQMALENYQQALAQAEILDDPYLKSRIYLHMGLLFERLKKDDDAIKWYGNAISNALEIDGSLTPLEALTARPYLEEGFSRVITLLMESGRDEEAYRYCQLAKEKEFLEYLDKAFPFSGRDSKTPAAIREERKIFLSIRQLARDKREARELKTARELIDRIEELKKTYEGVYAALEISHPAYCLLVKPKACSIQEITYAIDRKDAIMEYFIAGEKVFVWYVDEKEFQGFTVPLTRREIDDCLPLPGDTVKSRNLERHNPSDTVGKLFLPVLDRLEKRDAVVIIPHRELILFPFNAALHSNGASALRDHALFLSPSLTSWIATPLTKAAQPGLMAILAAGDSSADPLPQSLNEAEAIFPLLSPRIILRDGEMNRARVVENMEKASYIHYAGNCLIDPRNPILSGFALVDGALWGGDLYTMSIPAELAVISSHHDMLMDQSAGVVTILRALLGSGVRSVVMNSVDIREETRIFFFRELYNSLREGITVSESFRLAQLKTIGEFPRSDEWAYFTLYARRPPPGQ